MSVVVTGGLGFIGAHVAAALADLSLDVSCVVDHIDLMETFLEPSGARHEVKLQFPLGGGGTA